MAEQISEKNTKAEILNAYNEALTKLKEQKIQDRKAEKKKEDEEKVVQSASQNSTEKILKNIGEIKLDVLNALENLSEKLVAEFKKLTEIQNAIEIEKKYLQEVYDIKLNSDSLAALLLSQKEKKENFEAEIAEKKVALDNEIISRKAQWKTEIDNYENQKKEREALLKKERQREEEEYNYNLQLTRKKETDIYNEKKTALEKELAEKKINFEKEFAEREASITLKEKEYNDLKSRVEQFPEELQKGISNNERIISERIEFKYKHQIELTQKEIEGERNLNKQMIISLENKIKEQEEQIKQLTQKANESNQQVQTIAIKAIESSATRLISGTHPIPSEREKGQ